MPITTVEQAEAQTGLTYTTAQQARLTSVLLARAERFVRDQAGLVFYVDGDADADASQDWLLAVSLVADGMLRAEDPETRAALLGPYQSERLGDYQYTLKSGAGASIGDYDPRVWEIISRYRVVAPLIALVVNGPTRMATPAYDAEIDVSRGLL